jgi:hypothetical protein
MKRIYLLLLFSVNICLSIYSQTIRGTVFDKDSKGPIAFASVFFNGTTSGTTTDNNGNFSLNVSKNGTLPIAINAIGYFSILLSHYSPDSALVVYLNPKAYDIGEIAIYAKKSNRKKYLEWFKIQFLGQPLVTSKCTILNESDLAFQYSRKDNTLKVSSNNPLIINNKALGYKITYYLNSFEYLQSDMYLQYMGYFIFEDDLSLKRLKRARVEKMRKSAYLGSRMHFIRSLWQNNLDSDGFSIVSSSNQILTYDSLVVQTDTSTKYLKDKRLFDILYKGKPGSSMLETTKDSVYFEKSGYFDGYGIIWGGVMARQRMSELLPFDYSIK